MRIAFVHSFYSSAQPSGENAVVTAEIDALRRAGHEVELFAAYTDELEKQPLYSVRAALRVATGRGASPIEDLRAFDPDVVHVHNLFPNFGTKWLDDIDVPLVVTLHNFRPLCAAYTLYRDGQLCTDCVTKSWPSLVHGCYRGSRAATLPLTIGLRGGASRNRLLQRADRVLVLTEFAREIYARGGVDEGRLEVVPNFVPDSIAGDVGNGGDGWLYAGRLSAEKGIVDLIRSWPSELPITVVGSGDQLTAVEEAAVDKQVRLVGPLPRAEVSALMRSADGLVFPSLCPENFPLVYAEALAAGVPVAAFEGSSVADLVRRDATGSVLHWGDPVGAGLEGTLQVKREKCRSVFQASYSEAAFSARAERMYEEVRTGSAGVMPAPRQ